jgi:gamma-glutamylcyclotransferase (GGCT)/AIG2-like uncharacterized protein YtfP
MRLFVYGTLKRGQRNHARFLSGVRQIEPAAVVGRLYQLPVGYPMLAVPPESILAIGTADYPADEQLELRLCETAPQRLEAASPSQSDAATQWCIVQGEVITFDDPAARLPKLDRLEQFVPGGESFYDRVLIRPLAPLSGVLWTYVASGGRLPEGARQVESWG